MSHQRYLSHDPIKEPHSVSVKVLRFVLPARATASAPPKLPSSATRLEPHLLRLLILTLSCLHSLSCPSLVPQYPIEPPCKPSTTTTTAAAATASPLPASLAYHPSSTNPSPFLLSPILNLPVSFGSAYVGETFSCTLCANNDLDSSTATKRQIRDVRVEAEMKTPGQAKAQSLELGPATSQQTDAAAAASTDLAPGGTLQKIVSFDLKEEGNHVLAVTVSYYEAAETSGRTRTFRKLYQFICKPSLIVRTKVGVLEAPSVVATNRKKKKQQQMPSPQRRWVLEAQLENCSDDTMQLDRVVMELEPGLTCRDCNWTAGSGSAGVQKPVLQPGEVEQVCFVVETRRGGDGEEKEQEDVVASPRAARAAGGPDARVVFGVLGIGWRGEMGNRGFLSTGKLGTRVVR
ncbi:hypothetical protein G3M48_006724 [Beauveria asiatica]|uniref:DUF974 domain-containing protein n=1 Tax=Beauveria asiatica TaxID=1069075 RepID=A0AAW0RNZ7_9HYPO